MREWVEFQKKKIKMWIEDHKLIIQTKREHKQEIDQHIKRFMKILSRNEWTAINPVIHDLEKLRKNTWDQDKITKIQEWLKQSFKPEEYDDTNF